MSKIEKIINELLQYYTKNRGVGHTNTIFQGAYGTGSLVLSCNHEDRRYMKKVFDYDNIVTISEVERDVLKGTTGQPIAIDNHALYDILNSVLVEFSRKNEQIEELEHRLLKIKRLAKQN